MWGIFRLWFKKLNTKHTKLTRKELSVNEKLFVNFKNFCNPLAVSSKKNRRHDRHEMKSYPSRDVIFHTETRSGFCQDSPHFGMAGSFKYL